MQDFGFSTKEYQDKPLLGGHPPILLAGILVSGQNLISGTVVGTITASGKNTQLDLTASDGSETASTVIFGDLDASAGDEPGIFVEHGVVMGMYLTWPAGITSGEKNTAIAQLKTKGIYVQ